MDSNVTHACARYARVSQRCIKHRLTYVSRFNINGWAKWFALYRAWSSRLMRSSAITYNPGRRKGNQRRRTEAGRATSQQQHGISANFSKPVSQLSRNSYVEFPFVAVARIRVSCISSSISVYHINPPSTKTFISTVGRLRSSGRKILGISRNINVPCQVLSVLWNDAIEFANEVS